MGERTLQDLKMKQALPLDAKVLLTKSRIREWVNHYGVDGVYVSFSGGKDSTVLLHLVREMYPNIEAVFVDTGLEYPEIRDFVKTFDNVTWLKPKMNFKKVIETYGYPFVSKEVSGDVKELRNWLDKRGLTWDGLLQSEEINDLKYAYRISDFLGIKRRGKDKENEVYQSLKHGKIPIRGQYLMGVAENPNNKELSPFNREKWRFLLESPYRISNQCCNIMKKQPVHKYAKETNKFPITGQSASESRLRTQKWIQNGCNGFNMKSPISNPMSFWTEQDVLLYIKLNNIPIASVYGDIVAEEKDELAGQETWSTLGIFDTGMPTLKTTGCQRTGCMFCGYGCHLEKGKGRFELMKETHPKQYEWIMKPWSEGGLGYKDVIDWLNENGNLNIKY